MEDIKLRKDIEEIKKEIKDMKEYLEKSIEESRNNFNTAMGILIAIMIIASMIMIFV